MPQNILVTGIHGFVGKHVARELSARRHRTIGVSRELVLNPMLKDFVASYYSCDLTDDSAVNTIPLEQIDAVINLAGLANVGDSFAHPGLYKKVNVAVLAVIGQKLVALGSKAAVIAVSTGAVYGADQEMPLNETSKLITAGSPYALSKIAMEQEAAILRSQGLNCIIVRPFNHIGPGQESGFLVPDLYKKILAASKTDGVLTVGDLSTRRDYTDVRDVAKAYVDLATTVALDHSVYNVCSGRSIVGQEILDLLLSEYGQKGIITIQQDPKLIRPDDPKNLFGNNQRLQTQTGWQPTIPIHQTIHDIVATV